MKERYILLILDLYQKQYDPLLGYAKSSLKNCSLAEEAVQEAFCIAMSKPEAIGESPNPQGWLVLTLRNIISNMKRRQKVARGVVSSYMGDQIDMLPGPCMQTSPELLYADLADTQEFRLMCAIALDGKSMIELADEMGISVSACKKRVQRARKFLQKKMKEILK